MMDWSWEFRYFYVALTWEEDKVVKCICSRINNINLMFEVNKNVANNTENNE